MAPRGHQDTSNMDQCHSTLRIPKSKAKIKIVRADSAHRTAQFTPNSVFKVVNPILKMIRFVSKLEFQLSLENAMSKHSELHVAWQGVP